MGTRTAVLMLRKRCDFSPYHYHSSFKYLQR